MLFPGLEELYKTHYIKIRNYFFWKVRSKHDADDLAQLVFIKVRNHIGRVENPVGYLYRSARNLLVDYYEKRSKTPIASDELIENHADNMVVEEEDEFDKELYKLVLEKTELLPPMQKNIMKLHIEGLSHQQIALRIDRNISQVAVELHRARKKIKHLINK